MPAAAIAATGSRRSEKNREQDDDRNRNAEQPEQNAFHDVLLG